MLLAVAIGDERRSKDELHVSEERMSLAAENAQLALWEWDMSRDEIWMTDEDASFFGCKPGERLDYATLAGRVHPDDRAARAAAIQRVLETNGWYEIEYRAVLPMARCDGSPRAVTTPASGMASL
jgi:two-component system sensor kinase FixL